MYPLITLYNFRLSRARRTVENAFGHMASRFRLLRRDMDQSYENCVKSVKAIVVLHNFLTENSKTYQNMNETDSGKKNLSGLDSISTNGRQFNASGSKEAKDIRNNLADYFFDKGAVPFQWERTFGKK